MSCSNYSTTIFATGARPIGAVLSCRVDLTKRTTTH